jgi:hypothetical protein
VLKPRHDPARYGNSGTRQFAIHLPTLTFKAIMDSCMMLRD